MASAIALLGCLANPEAHAVALGRITVQSALGEPLRAEIDVSDLSADEVSSLKVGVAGAEVFKASGLEYSAAVAGLDVRLQRRPDGRAFLRVISSRAITEPFVDLILEARWASGRVTRDYTMLFDPPNMRSNSAAVVIAPPALSREPALASVGSRQDAPAMSVRPAVRAASPEPRAPAPRPALSTTPVQRISGARQVTVRPGDNASTIAAQNKPQSVSLDQMLVAMLKGNPQAFVGGNVNLIKSGAVVDIPDAQAANVLSPAEARQTLVAQSRDFNAFRSRLAAGVPAAQLENADRQAGGKVQARVEDRAQANASPDKLTLSKGAVQGQQAEEQLAKNAAGLLADMPKNSSDQKLPVTGNALPGAPVSMPAAAPGMAGAGTPAITAMPALGAAAGAEPAASSAAAAPEALAPVVTPLAAASASTAASQAPVLTAPAAPPAKDGLAEQMVDNSLLLGGGFLLALLAAVGIYRYRKNRKTSHVDSSFLDSRLQPDSFFGASGGQRVDTSASQAPRSSMVYSPSQLDSTGDVDPVAEADVYLAYGRDQQAEEILKEALRTQPTRLAIHAKLTEIYAKRRDHKAFESVALTAFKLSAGQGPEWAHISKTGLELQPGNSMYAAGAKFSPSLQTDPFSVAEPVSTTVSQALAAITPAPKAARILDLDLDFPGNEASAAPKVIFQVAAGRPAAPHLDSGFSTNSVLPSAFLDMDLNLDDTPDAAPVLADRSALAPAFLQPFASTVPEIDYLAGGLDFTPEPGLSPAAAPVSHGGMMEFDLDSLSLDLGPASQPTHESAAQLEKDPLEIKFLLAEEFRILGDSEGARSLAGEVAAQAGGPLKYKAQAFLNTLS